MERGRKFAFRKRCVTDSRIGFRQEFISSDMTMLRLFMLFRFNDTHFPGVQVHFVSLKVPALIRAQPTGISHAEVSAEQERTEWLFLDICMYRSPGKRRQFIVPKQIRNKNCSRQR